MAEYIEREKVVSKFEAIKNRGVSLKDAIYLDGVMAVLDTIPAADVAPVGHGSWVFDHMTGERAYYANCSECGNRKHFVNQEAAQKEKYCSLCGARMDKEDNE